MIPDIITGATLSGGEVNIWMVNKKTESYPDEVAEQRMKLGRGGVVTPPSVSYRSISSSRGVASPAMDMGVLSIMGLGDGRGVILWAFFRPSASFSFSHCSAILPQSTAVALLLGLQGGWTEKNVFK